MALLLFNSTASAQTNVSGKAISFNATPGYLSVPAGVWFNSSFTIEGWVYVRSHQNWARLIDFSDGPDTYNVYLSLSGNNLGCPNIGVFGKGHSATVESSTQLPLNTWTHLAAVDAGGQTTIYINGKVVGTGLLMNAPGVLRTNNYIGRSAYSADAYPDAIFDDIRIWNVSRTQNEIQADMNHPLVGNEDYLVGYWRADEGSGPSAFSTVTNDPASLVDNGGTATLVGSASWTNSGALIAPALNYALAFTNTFVTVPHAAAQNAYPMTVMCWFSASTSGGAMVNKYVSSSYNGWQLAFGSQVHAFYYRDSTDSIGNTGSGAVDGAWHHAAWVVDSSGGRLYLDGILKSSTPWTGTAGASATTQPLSFGLYPGDSFFTGGIDEVSVWKTALTAAQIQYYKNYAPHGNEPGLVGLYRMNEGIGTNVFDTTTNLNTGFLSSPPPAWISSPAPIYLPPSIVFTQAVSYTGNNANLATSVNPNGSATAVWAFYYSGQTGTLITNLLSANIGNGSNYVSLPVVLANLPASAFYDVQIIASNAADRVISKDIAFVTPGGFAPSLGTPSASPAYTNANISIPVNPNSAPATALFAYGTTTNYGSTNIVANINSAQTVSSLVINLQPGTTYHLLVTATNSYGSTSGSDLVFVTAATAAPSLTNVIANTTFTNATLSALVDPGGADTTVWLAYGSTANYSNTNAFTIPGFGGPISISQVLSNLPIQSTYHFIVTASNSVGIVSSGDITFATFNYTLGSTGFLEPYQAGSDIVIVGMPAGTPWTASIDVPWLHLAGPLTGVGSQNITFNFDQNPGAPRTGTIQFGNQTVTVIQAGPTYVSTSAALDLYGSPDPDQLSYMAVDGGNNVYFIRNNRSEIARVDYQTKTITSVFTGAPFGCFNLGVDAFTNLYFFEPGYQLFELPFGASGPSLRYSQSGTGLMRVAPSGDLFLLSATNISLLPRAATTATPLFSGVDNLYDFTADAADNAYFNFYTNSIFNGTIYEWSPANPVLTPLFGWGLQENLTVDGSGNLYLFEANNYKRSALTGQMSALSQTNFLVSIIAGNWGDQFTIEYDGNNSLSRVREYEHAYINAQGLYESSAAGTGSIAAVVPTNAYLGGSLMPTSSAPWLTINGVTNGVITFSYTAFAGPGNRVAYINVLGIPIPVGQGATTYSLGASATVEPPSAGTDSVVLAVSPGFGPWTATTNASWLHLAPNMQSGAGSGPILFSFDANPGATRTGSLTLGDQTFTVTQAGSSYVAAETPIFLGAPTNGVSSFVVDRAGNILASTVGFFNGNLSETFWQWIRTNNTTYSSPNLPNSSLVTADWLGNLYTYVLPSGSPTPIQKYNLFNHSYTTVATPPSPYQPTVPAGFVVDTQSNILLFPSSTGNLTEYVPASGQSQTAAFGPFQSQATTIDPAGNVFWADLGPIREWNAVTLQTTVLLTNINSQSVAADAGGNVYFSDVNDQYFPQIQKLSPSGDLSTVPLPPSAYPARVAVDPSGNLYFSESDGFYEVPRAFLDPTPKVESLAAGTDALPTVLYTNTDLTHAFAPTSDQSWLTITGVSNGVVHFAFTSSATARIGNITLLGQNIVVSQGTNYWLGITNLFEGPGAGSDTFVFGTIPVNTSWSASANAPWLHIATSGNGGGNIVFSYDANSGSTRLGTITIAGQTLTVVQAGSSYVQVNSPLTLTSGATGNGAPCGVAVDAKGNVYYCDTYNYAVKVWNPTTNHVTTLASTGLNLPYALAVDTNSGNVYIADTYNSVLKKWSPGTGTITTVVPSGLNTPFGVAVDSAGFVYIGDTGNGAIEKWNLANNSMVLLYFDPGSAPMGVAVDAIGNVYWVDANSEQVFKWSVITHQAAPLFAPGLSQPYGVAVDGGGNVYVADYNNAVTYKWSAASNTVSNLPGETIGVAVDTSGNLFIADAYESLIYKWPHAFVDPTPKNESLNAVQDVLPPVIPTNTDLLPPLAPSTNQPWLAITKVTNGIVSFSVSSTPSPRVGNITVLGQNVAIVQGTNTVLGTTNLFEGRNAGADSFVFGSISPTWSASANVPWLHIASSGASNGNIIFTYDANSGPTRSGTITISGRTVTVTQAGVSYVSTTIHPVLSLANNGPIGMALDAAGNVYYCDNGNNAVKMWCRTNNQVTTVVSAGLNGPYFVAIDSSNNLFIADTYNSAIKRWSSANSNLTTLVSGVTATGIGVDSNGNVYFCDNVQGDVNEWIAASNSVLTLYSNTNSYPLGLALDAIGNVYWVEGRANFVRKWSPIDKSTTTISIPGLNNPWGVAVDGSGNVYVADYGQNATYKWTAASNTVYTIGGQSTSVAVDAVGNLFRSDSWEFQMIYEMPRAFVDPTPKVESPAGGLDALPPILPFDESLLAPFDTTAGQPWIHLTGNTNGTVGFSVDPTTYGRSSSIVLYGIGIPILQANTGVPPILTGVQRIGPGTVQFGFTNNPFAIFTVLSATNPTMPLSNWTVLGTATNLSDSLYQFTDPNATNPVNFYRVRSP